jgi:hypothetical protein
MEQNVNLNIKQIKINDLIKEDNKEKEKIKKTLIRLDSPINDNESNTILFTYPNDNNKVVKNVQNNKNIYSHDKEIMEDSIIYFTQKLKKNNIEYHKYLYFSIGLYFIDLIISYFDKQILHTKYNLYSLIIILSIAIIQAYSFKHNFESISKEKYIFTQRIIYIYCFALILFLLNIIYIFFKIIFNQVDINNIYQKRILNFFGFSLLIFFYIIINFIIPIIVLIQLISLKRNIKNLSAAKGEVYETVKIKDSQIINSIIN